MSPVPSTPTATDKQEEVRKLNIEIAGLTAAKDTALRMAGTAHEAVSDATKRAQEADEHLKMLEHTMAGSAAEIGEFVDHCKNVIQSALLAMEEVVVHVKNMQQRITKLNIEIDTQEKTLNELHTSIVKENEEIERKRGDLDIYHKRVNKLYAAQELPKPII